jgi:hypothetical protein
MAFQKAKREQICVKVLLGGPSGSGKTYSALRLATGLAKKTGSRIAAIDTEAGRLKYYADEFDFDYQQLSPPFTPEAYNKMIEECIEEGYKILVIDSITHEWKGKGGCIEIHDAIPGNTYTAWGKVKPRHQTFVDTLIESPIHIICTARGKDEYTLEEKNGKQVPKKVGVGLEQQDDAEYNYTVTFNLDQESHVAAVMKDNTHLFEDKYEVLTEKHGAALYEWANEGDAATPPPKKENPKATDAETLAATKKQIVAACTEKGGSKNEELMTVVKNYEPSGNPNKIKNIKVAKDLLEAVEAIEFVKEENEVNE